MGTSADELLALLGLPSFGALDLAPDPMLVVDVEGRFCFANKAMASVPGFVISARVGDHIDTILDASIAEAVAARLRALLANAKVDGDNPNHLDPRLTPLETSFHLTIGVLLAWSRKEPRLKPHPFLQRAHIQAWLDKAPYLIWFKDTHGYFQIVNDAFAHATGKTSAKDLIGLDDLAVWPTEQAARYADEDREIMRTREHKLIEESIFIAGEYRWFEIWKSPVIDDTGEVMGTAGFCRDITRHRDLGDHERRSHEQLRALAAHMESIREQERVHLAREIHDELGQALTCMGMDLAFLDKHLDPANQEATARVAALGVLVKETIRCVRRISSELRPSILDDLGLGAAIEWLANDFETRTHIHCRSAVEEELDLDPAIATALFRICQEALTNVARHANATSVGIDLHVEDHLVHLEIVDNGIGISPEAINRHGSLGLLGMHERVALQGGTMDIRGEHGNGTVLTVTVPLANPRPA